MSIADLTQGVRVQSNVLKLFYKQTPAFHIFTIPDTNAIPKFN